jgi:hypothetical protein
MTAVRSGISHRATATDVLTRQTSASGAALLFLLRARRRWSLTLNPQLHLLSVLVGATFRGYRLVAVDLAGCAGGLYRF